MIINHIQKSKRWPIKFNPRRDTNVHD